MFSHLYSEGPKAQWVMHRPNDLPVPGSSPACDKMISTINKVPLHTLSAVHRPDMTELLLKRM